MRINNSLLSNTITYLRLPLMVLVVFIHTNLLRGDSSLVAGSSYPVYNILRHIVSDEIARIAVPLFFFISGFLFFLHADFSLSVYKSKLKKRARTLLFPYLFWNVLVWFLFFLLQNFFPTLISGNQKQISTYTLLDYLGIFWDYKGGMPICYQLWFVRNLLVVVLCTPLVYCLIRYLKCWGVLFLGILWCLGMGEHIVGLSSSAFFFFSWGAWFAIGKRDFVSYFKPWRKSVLMLYLAVVLLNTVIWWFRDFVSIPFLLNVGIILGMITVLAWTAYGIEKQQLRCNEFLAGSSFFVYAYHGVTIDFFIRQWLDKVYPSTEFTMILGYILIPFGVVALGVVAYAILHRLFPRFAGLITGGR